MCKALFQALEYTIKQDTISLSSKMLTKGKIYRVTEKYNAIQMLIELSKG